MENRAVFGTPSLRAEGPRLEVNSVLKVVLDGALLVGIWSDLDGQEIRTALSIVGIIAPVRYLDGEGIPDRYRLRAVPGEPTPRWVLAAMEQQREDPWAVRDQLLSERAEGLKATQTRSA